jgi:cob(I)alamin adenosyltransferase
MTIALDQIITRTGDDGRTDLADGGRVAKTDARVEALGAIDELNAQIGVARAQPGASDEHDAVLRRVQQRLFDLSADLAHPDPVDPDASADADAGGAARIDAAEIAWLEETAAPIIAALPPLTSFVVPGGGLYAAHLHTSRTACRSAERRVVAIFDGDAEQPSDPGAGAIAYLNRLSDLLFVLARAAAEGTEATWTA